KIELTHKTNKFSHYLGLHDVNAFILRHPELLTGKFKFNGGVYEWDPEGEKCIEVVPAAANLLKRVKDDFFKTNFRPDKYGNKEEVQVSIKKSTIIDVYGRGILK